MDQCVKCNCRDESCLITIFFKLKNHILGKWRLIILEFCKKSLLVEQKTCEILLETYFRT